MTCLDYHHGSMGSKRGIQSYKGFLESFFLLKINIPKGKNILLYELTTKSSCQKVQKILFSKLMRNFLLLFVEKISF